MARVGGSAQTAAAVTAETRTPPGLPDEGSTLTRAFRYVRNHVEPGALGHRRSLNQAATGNYACDFAGMGPGHGSQIAVRASTISLISRGCSLALTGTVHWPACWMPCSGSTYRGQVFMISATRRPVRSPSRSRTPAVTLRKTRRLHRLQDWREMQSNGGFRHSFTD